MPEKLRVLFFDIETAPSLGYVWSLWKELAAYQFIKQDWYILCWSAKWLGEDEIYSSALVDFKDYKKNPSNDKHVLEKLHKLLDEADVVIAHNGVNFDRKKVNARFLVNDIKPVAPYRMVDTLDIAKREFDFTSNKLGDLAEFLKVGKKVDTGGFQLWKDCMEGKKDAWNKMVEYCKRDIVILEKVYLKLLAFTSQHPNMALETGERCCPKCGSSKIHYRGYIKTNLAKYRRFVCTSCGGWGRDRENLLTKDQRSTLTVNA